MAPKLSLSYLALAAVLGFIVYGYTSYYTIDVPLPRPVSTPSLGDKNASTLPDLQEWRQQQNVSSIAPSSVSVTVALVVTPNTTQKLFQPDPNKGIKTRSMYVAGHHLPRPEICPDLGMNLKLLCLIMSAPSHFDARMAIRQTWGHYASRSDVTIAFLLGKTDNEKVDAAIAEEGNLYMDIVKGNFMDSYNNLTLKTVSMMEWVSDYCPLAKYVLKTDDDMFINIPKLLSFIDKHANDKNVVFGRLAKRWKPIRNVKSKYYVSRNQYHPPVFPDFTTGPAYIFQASLAGDFYAVALDQTYLKLEDVFMTGVVAQKLKVKRTHAAEFLNKRVPMNACTVQRTISIHMVKFSEQFDLWKKLLDGKAKCK